MRQKLQDENPQKVESTELLRTSQSWDGVELPDYFHVVQNWCLSSMCSLLVRNWAGIITP